MRFAIQQQEELHRIKMQNEEKQLKMITALRKKAEGECKLALLTLKRFKDSGHSIYMQKKYLFSIKSYLKMIFYEIISEK